MLDLVSLTSYMHFISFILMCLLRWLILSYFTMKNKRKLELNSGRRQWHPTPVLLPVAWADVPVPCAMGRGAWWAAVHGVAKSQTRLSDFTFTFHFHALEKEMVTHSSVLIWRIPGTGEPGGLLSMGSHRVGHDWRDLAAAAKMLK